MDLVVIELCILVITPELTTLNNEDINSIVCVVYVNSKKMLLSII